MNIKYAIKYKSTNKLGQEHIFDTYYGTTYNKNGVDNLEAISKITEFNHRMEVLEVNTDMGEGNDHDHEHDEKMTELNEAWYGTECSLIKVNISITNIEETV